MLPTNALCFEAADFNGVENDWNRVQIDLKELENAIKMLAKKREELIQRLKQILDRTPNSYSKNLYGSYPDFWKNV